MDWPFPTGCLPSLCVPSNLYRRPRLQGPRNSCLGALVLSVTLSRVITCGFPLAWDKTAGGTPIGLISAHWTSSPAVAASPSPHTRSLSFKLKPQRSSRHVRLWSLPGCCIQTQAASPSLPDIPTLRPFLSEALRRARLPSRRHCWRIRSASSTASRGSWRASRSTVPALARLTCSNTRQAHSCARPSMPPQGALAGSSTRAARQPAGSPTPSPSSRRFLRSKTKAPNSIPSGRPSPFALAYASIA